MIQVFSVEEGDLDTLIEETLEEAQRLISNKKFGNSVDFMTVRDVVKGIFVRAENETNSPYIGILEWSIVEELLKQVRDTNQIASLSSIKQRFSGHPNIKLISRPNLADIK